MLARLNLCVLAAWTVIAAGNVYGQYGPPGGAYSQMHAQQANYQAFTPHPGYYGPPPGSADEQVDPRIITELLPADRGFFWDTQSRLETAIEDTSHGAWFRLEYLNTFIDNPGDTLLGAPLPNVPNPREPFLVQTPSGAVVNARVLDVSAVNFDNINGIRGTFGIPLQPGTIEASFWGTSESTYRFRSPELPATNPLQTVDVIATSLLTNNAPGGFVVLYDNSFRYDYAAQIFGAEANFVYNYHNPRLGLRCLPIFGVRHTDYDESIKQRGTFNNRSGIGVTPGGASPILPVPLVRQIDSWVDNNSYALQTGFRTEFAHQYFTLGVEPKAGLGMNHYEATVRTVDLRDSPFPPIQDDGVVTSNIQKDTISAVFDLQLYAKVHLSDSCRIRVGWSYMYMGNVARADSIIHYNDQGLALPPAVTAKKDDQSIWVSSFTIGGEYILP